MQWKSARLTVVLIATLTVAAMSIAFGQDDHGDHSHPGPGAPSVAGGKPSLDHEMGAMNKAYRLIRKQVKDGTKNVSTLAAVGDLETHTLAAKAIVPNSATTMPTAEADTEKLKQFDLQLINLLRTELTLEEQLRNDDNVKAAATVATLRDLEHRGHDAFRMKDD